MPKANEVANELRKLADSLDVNPDADMVRPSISWYHWSESHKDKFLAVARLLPRPLNKKVGTGEHADLTIEYRSDALLAYASIPRSLTCELVEPAKAAVYKCEPILSQLEESELEGTNV